MVQVDVVGNEVQKANDMVDVLIGEMRAKYGGEIDPIYIQDIGTFKYGSWGMLESKQ